MLKFDTWKFIHVPGSSSTNDLRQEIQRLLKVAKNNLETKKRLVPMGFIVKPDGTLDLYTRNTTPQSSAKDASHQMLSDKARVCNATAVILLTDVWVKWLEGMSDQEKLVYISRYRNGDLENDTDQRRECLLCNVFGPSVDYSIACFYHRAAGGNIIVWDEEIDSLESKHNLFEQYLVAPWWDTDKKPTVS